MFCGPMLFFGIVEFVYGAVSGFLLRCDVVGSDVVMLYLVMLLRLILSVIY
jgi:hypothetical protein